MNAVLQRALSQRVPKNEAPQTMPVRCLPNVVRALQGEGHDSDATGRGAGVPEEVAGVAGPEVLLALGVGARPTTPSLTARSQERAVSIGRAPNIRAIAALSAARVTPIGPGRQAVGIGRAAIEANRHGAGAEAAALTLVGQDRRTVLGAGHVLTAGCAQASGTVPTRR